MAFSAFERTVALRYLRPRRQEGFVSVIAGFSFLGILLGVATLIIVMSVMNGFREDLMGRILGLNGHLGVYAQASEPLRDYEASAEAIRRVPGVTSATPLVEAQVMATSEGRATGAVVRGVLLSDLQGRPLIAQNIVAGSLDAFLPPDAIMIGEALGRRMGMGVGDRLTLVSPQGNPTAFGTLPRQKSYEVVALFDVGMHEYNNNFIFMPLEAAQLFFRMQGAVSNLEVFVQEPDSMRAVMQDVARAAGQPVYLRDWQQANATFFNALQVERNVMFLILTLIILVAAFNIISSMIMMVKDKGRAIAILRTMGATRGAILRIFMMTGASVGVAGTLGGFALGLAFCDNISTIQGWVEVITGSQVFAPEIYYLTRLPAKVEMGEVTVIVGMALVLSFLATLYPSWRAARLDPVEALRNE